jgi:hypothetical protein
MSEIEDRIATNTQRQFWSIKLAKGEFVPAKELLNIAIQGLERFKQWNAEMPLPKTTAWIAESDRWIERNFMKISKQIELENRKGE